MLQGRPDELQHLNDFLVSIGYKTSYPTAFNDFMYKSDCNFIEWIYDSCKFTIEYTRKGRFIIRMDCVINNIELSECYDSTKGTFIKYSKKNLEIPFEDANLPGIENNLMRNIKIIKEYHIEQKKQEIEKGFSMTIEEIEKILLNNGFVNAVFRKPDTTCIWNYPETVPTFINNRFLIYCCLFFNKQNNCIENCIEIYDTSKTSFILQNYLDVCPVKEELHLLNEEKLMNVINSQKDLYNKMMKIVKQIMIDEKINDLDKDFDNDK